MTRPRAGSANKRNGLIQHLLELIPEPLKSLCIMAFSTAPISVADKVLPFVNPKIVQDIWWIAVVAMVIASGISCVATLPNSGASRRAPGYVSAFVFFVSLGALLAITGDVLVFEPVYAAALTRGALVGLFAGIADFISFMLTWGLRRWIGWEFGPP